MKLTTKGRFAVTAMLETMVISVYENDNGHVQLDSARELLWSVKAELVKIERN